MSLAYFYSKDNKTLISMDIETAITFTQTNQATKSSMMTGAQAADGFTIGNKVVTLAGLVTSSKTPSQADNLSPEDFRSYIDETITNGSRFSVHFAFPSAGTKLLDRVDNCIITNLSYLVDKYEDTMTVSLTFEEQFVSPAATETELPPELASEAAKSYSSPDGDPTSGTKKNNDTATTKKSILYMGAEALESTTSDADATTVTEG